MCGADDGLTGLDADGTSAATIGGDAVTGPVTGRRRRGFPPYFTAIQGKSGTRYYWQPSSRMRRDDGIAAVPLGGDLEDAIRQARELNARARKERVDYKVQSARETVLAQAAEIALNAKKRAKARELEFALTADDIVEMLEEQDGRCALSGIPFDAETRLGHRRPYKPSIDRVDSSRGYLRDNVRLVCVAINYALGDWGEAVLVHLAERIVATRKMKSRARTSD